MWSKFILFEWSEKTCQNIEGVPELGMTPELKTRPQRIPTEKVVQKKSSQMCITKSTENNESQQK